MTSNFNNNNKSVKSVPSAQDIFIQQADRINEHILQTQPFDIVNSFSATQINSNGHISQTNLGGENVTDCDPDLQTDLVTNKDVHQQPENYLVQWNCNGFYAHHEDFQVLSRELKPCVICIQETLTGEGETLKLKDYRSYLRSDEPGASGRKKGGCGILVREDCPSKQIALSN